MFDKKLHINWIHVYYVMQNGRSNARAIIVGGNYDHEYGAHFE